MSNKYELNHGNTDSEKPEVFHKTIKKSDRRKVNNTKDILQLLMRRVLLLREFLNNVNRKLLEFQEDLRAAEVNDYRVYDYQEIDRLREKRESDFIPTSEDAKQEKFLTPLYVITGFFAAIMIIGPFLVRQGPNKGLVQACILLTAFCMWIFWFTIYFGQMNPLMGPRLENTTVAWIAYKLGKPLNTTS